MREANGEIFDRYFSEPEEKRLFTAVKRIAEPLAQRDYCWMLLLRHTAIRESELLNLSVGDAKAFVRHGRISIMRLKKRKLQAYEFYANKKAMQALKGLIRSAEQLRRDDAWLDTPLSEQPLLISRNQKPMSARAMQLRLKKWLSEAELALPATPHWFRHTWAKRRLAADNTPATLLKVQAHLGHKALSTTAIYLAPDKESMRDFLALTH